VFGAIVAAAVLYVIASGQPEFSLSGGFAANGYGEHSPGGYSIGAALVAEIVLTFFFLMIIMGATDKRAPAGFSHLDRLGSGLCDPWALCPSGLAQKSALHGAAMAGGQGRLVNSA
jgi:aquaporin Z